MKVGARRAASPQPVYFLSLSLENVRSFGPPQTLDLSDGQGRPAKWTIILGNNGVGKTTLLRALTAFEAVPSVPRDLFVPRGLAEFDLLYALDSKWSLLRQGSRSADLSATLFAGQLKEGRARAGARERLVLTLTSEPNSAVGSPVPPPFRGLLCYGYGATRRMGAGAISSAKEAGPSDSLFFEDVPLRNAEEWFMQADYAASRPGPGQQDARSRRDNVKQLLLDLLPEVTDLRSVVPIMRSPARVEVKTPYGWVGVQDLSLGYRTLIAWMVDLASRLFERYPDSSNPLAEPAVVLVDEIDLHLHPTWQRQLIGYLTERFPNTQFIVTAHSPLVVQSATDANIVVLRREGDHVRIDNESASIHGWRVDQILTSDLFGLESARPPQIEGLLKERTDILSKPRLTAKDKARLHELETLMGPRPAGETQAEREAFDIIQRFAERVRKDRK